MQSSANAKFDFSKVFIYFNLKTYFSQDSVSRIPVTSRKSSMPPEDESEEDKTIRVEIGEDDNNSLTSTTQLESFSILNPGRPDVSQHNVSSLSENVLDGLFQKESVNQGQTLSSITSDLFIVLFILKVED